jgi:hypothetical protein
MEALPPIIQVKIQESSSNCTVCNKYCGRIIASKIQRVLNLVLILIPNKIGKVFQKGTDPKIDSYSGFYDNGKMKDTGLNAYLIRARCKAGLCGWPGY